MSTTRTTVYLNTIDYRRLQARAAAEGRSAAELVREAVSEYVRRVEEEQPRPRSIGKGRSGRGDLSTTAEELLEGMGET